jgi:cyclic pyranopterin phosphate synthase
VNDDLQEGILLYRMENKLNHFDAQGNAVMVDVSGKEITSRVAVARGAIRVNETVMQAVCAGTVKKGDVLGVARVAGIMGVKQTSSLIPMCHPLMIQKCSVDFEIEEEKGLIHAICRVKTAGQTGVEMEALTGAATALLTIYDMCKALDRSMEITGVHLVEKDGGRSGHYVCEKDMQL